MLKNWDAEHKIVDLAFSCKCSRSIPENKQVQQLEKKKI